MVNKNTVSLGVKLLIKPPFKIFPLQFFSQCFPSKLQLLLLIYLFMYLFSLRFRVFFSLLKGEGVFLHFSPFTSCGIQRSHFLSVIWSTAFQKQLSGSNQKMGGVGVILNYWTQAETWAMDMAPDFPPLHFFPCLCQLQGFLSVVRTMRGWCWYLEGDVLYSDLVQMHPIMIMFCYLYVPSAPFPLLWKSERHKQLQRLLPFNQVFTTATLLSYHTAGRSSLSLCSTLQPAYVEKKNCTYKLPTHACTHTHKC